MTVQFVFRCTGFVISLDFCGHMFVQPILGWARDFRSFVRVEFFRKLSCWFSSCESGCAYHGITDFVTNTLMKVQHDAVSENSVHNYCVPRTVIWTWRFVLSRQT